MRSARDTVRRAVLAFRIHTLDIGRHGYDPATPPSRDGPAVRRTLRPRCCSTVPIRDLFRRDHHDDVPAGGVHPAATADRQAESGQRDRRAPEEPPITRHHASRFSPRHWIGHGHRDDIPDNLWVRCGNDRCRDVIYVREFEKNLRVCQKCEHHARLSASERLAQLLDEASFLEEDTDIRAGDPLHFVSAGQTYRDKLAETQRKTALAEAVVTGTGAIEMVPLRVAVADFGFLGASMGSVVGEKIARAVEHSIDDRLPLLAVTASGGARMHEGIFSLMQMAKTAAALARLSDAHIPFFCLLTDPTTGGVTASFAGLGDVMLAEPGALIGFAGPRVIEQITKQKLPPGTQRSEFQLEHGTIDAVVHRRDLRPTLARLLRLYGERTRPAATPATSRKGA
ncbi:MAG: acetyl-CoA carboxylase carboxyltransferase subunit beta [Chloroflexi bacterium]|nr:acetyl-CoA carboxylase carboxyltransferase subunit beta [Chloroflexota bacterium]